MGKEDGPGCFHGGLGVGEAQMGSLFETGCEHFKANYGQDLQVLAQVSGWLRKLTNLALKGVLGREARADALGDTTTPADLMLVLYGNDD
jgi:hypothetical protein